jgi:hypothetical protein
MTRNRNATETAAFAFSTFLRPYRYVLYHLLSRMESRNIASPIFRALAAMALLVFMNLAWVVFTVAVAIGTPLHRLSIGRLEAFPLLSVFFFVFYMAADAAWISNGKLSALRHEFSGASTSQERVRDVMFWTYAVLSIVSLPLTGMVAHALR